LRDGDFYKNEIVYLLKEKREGEIW